MFAGEDPQSCSRAPETRAKVTAGLRSTAKVNCSGMLLRLVCGKLMSVRSLFRLPTDSMSKDLVAFCRPTAGDSTTNE